MPTIRKPTGGTHEIGLKSEIARVYFEGSRAKDKDKVKVHVETKFVKDGTAVKLDIREEDSGDAGAGGDDAVETLDGKIDKGECVVEWTVDLSKPAIAGEADVEGEDFEFICVAKIADYKLEKKSANMVLVPNAPFRLSY